MTYRPLVYATGVAALVALATGVVLAGAAGGDITGSVKTGRYDIKDVPPGSYTIAAWSEKGKAQPKSVTVEAGKPVTVDFAIGK